MSPSSAHRARKRLPMARRIIWPYRPIVMKVVSPAHVSWIWKVRFQLGGKISVCVVARQWFHWIEWRLGMGCLFFPKVYSRWRDWKSSSAWEGHKIRQGLVGLSLFFSGRFEIWGFPKYNLIYTVPVYRYIIVYIYIYICIYFQCLTTFVMIWHSCSQTSHIWGPRF